VSDNQPHPLLCTPADIPTLSGDAPHDAVSANDADADAERWPPPTPMPHTSRLTLLAPTPAQYRASLVQEIDKRLDEPFRPTRERPCPTMKKRGVYLSDSFDDNGNPWVYAVTTGGRVAHCLKWRDGDSLELMTAELWDILDERDTQLTLSRSSSGAVVVPLDCLPALV
jgi:hypothetical protein